MNKYKNQPSCGRYENSLRLNVNTRRDLANPKKSMSNTREWMKTKKTTINDKINLHTCSDMNLSHLGWFSNDY